MAGCFDNSERADEGSGIGRIVFDAETVPPPAPGAELTIGTDGIEGEAC